MPILDVEIVVDEDELIPDKLAGRLADAAGKVFGSPAGQTWIRLRRLSRTDYAENEGGPPAGVRPVFATVLKRRLPDQEEMANECRALTRAIASLLNRPAENVHLFYLPDGVGRVSFGGILVD